MTVVDTFSVVIVALVITGLVVLVGVRAHSDDQGEKDLKKSLRTSSIERNI